MKAKPERRWNMSTLEQLLAQSKAKQGKSEYSVEVVNNETDGVFYLYFDNFNELEEILDHEDATFSLQGFFTSEYEIMKVGINQIQSIIEIIEGEFPKHATMEVYIELIDNGFAQWDNVEKFFEDNFVCEYINDEQFGKEIAEREEIIKDELSRKYWDYKKFGQDKQSEYPIMLGLAFRSS